MQIGRIEGCTHVIGKSQGYMGLPIRLEAINCAVNGPGTPAMSTAWFPTPKELVALNDGAAVHVRLICEQHPPIMVDVGPVPEMAPQQVTGGQINIVLRAVRQMTPNGDAQLSILARALVTGCKSCKVSKATMLKIVEEMFDEPTNLVPLDGPGSGS